MQITPGIREKLKAYQEDTGSTLAEIGAMIGLSAAPVSRLLAGKTSSINDTSGVKLLRLLGIDAPEIVAAPRRQVIEATYRGTDMEPLIGNGQVLLCESVKPADLKQDDIVVAEITDTSGKRHIRRTVCRIWQRIGDDYMLAPESEDGEAYFVSPTALHWVARVAMPIRRVGCGDA